MPTRTQDRRCTYNVTQARSRNHCCSGKAIIIACYECCSLALGIQHAKRMHLIVICVLSGSTLFYKLQDFRGGWWGGLGELLNTTGKRYTVCSKSSLRKSTPWSVIKMPKVPTTRNTRCLLFWGFPQGYSPPKTGPKGCTETSANN